MRTLRGGRLRRDIDGSGCHSLQRELQGGRRRLSGLCHRFRVRCRGRIRLHRDRDRGLLWFGLRHRGNGRILSFAGRVCRFAFRVACAVAAIGALTTTAATAAAAAAAARFAFSAVVIGAFGVGLRARLGGIGNARRSERCAGNGGHRHHRHAVLGGLGLHDLTVLREHLRCVCG